MRKFNGTTMWKHVRCVLHTLIYLAVNCIQFIYMDHKHIPYDVMRFTCHCQFTGNFQFFKMTFNVFCLHSLQSISRKRENLSEEKGYILRCLGICMTTVKPKKNKDFSSNQRDLISLGAFDNHLPLIKWISVIFDLHFPLWALLCQPNCSFKVCRKKPFITLSI